MTMAIQSRSAAAELARPGGFEVIVSAAAV